MAEVPLQRKFTAKDWKAAAEYVQQEYQRRKSAPIRTDRERIWKEVDRQIAMAPAPREVLSGTAQDWMPNLELPLQAEALEILTADARRLKFPKTTDWFRIHSNLSDEYLGRFQERRERLPIIGGEATPLKLDQETADIFVKAAMDRNHQAFNFRQQIDACDIEAFKYGTYGARVREVMLPKFTADFRGIKGTNVRGPVVIPVSIKNTFLDDSTQAVLHEGMAVAPAHIFDRYQKLDDLLLSAQQGGTAKGWLLPNIKKLSPMGSQETKDKTVSRGHVQLLEMEGDIIFPRSQNNIFLPNVIITVAVGGNGPTVVRFQENTQNFRSYSGGTYQRDDLNSPYGTSPLMKGQPIQEAATDALNRMMAVAALSSQPPISWDSTDTQLRAAGGPQIYPGAQWPTDDLNSIKDHKIGDLAESVNLYLALLQQYEDMTGVNAPRRGAQTKSHTTAYAVDVESSRGMVRTDDFVVLQEEGFLSSILYKEFEILKKTMGTQSVYVGSNGVDGYVNIARQDLPDDVTFVVEGSSGPISKREQQQALINAAQMAAQLSEMSMQVGGPIVNFAEVMKVIFEQGANVPNAERFITSPQGVPGQTDGVGGVPGGAGMVPGEPA